jgi:hypothetical protein
MDRDADKDKDMDRDTDRDIDSDRTEKRTRDTDTDIDKDTNKDTCTGRYLQRHRYGNKVRQTSQFTHKQNVNFCKHILSIKKINAKIMTCKLMELAENITPLMKVKIFLLQTELRF